VDERLEFLCAYPKNNSQTVLGNQPARRCKYDWTNQSTTETTKDTEVKILDRDFSVHP
jgi:hypothetical protein